MKNLVLKENIEDFFFVKSLETPYHLDVILFYVDQKERDKEWNFTLNLN